MRLAQGHGQALVRWAEPVAERRHALDILRIVSICGVVAIHVFGHVVGQAPDGGRSWWLAAGVDIAFIWVVPVFVMISGALILGSRQALEDPRAFYFKRAARLLPALIVWNLVYLIGVRVLLRHEQLTPGRIVQLLVDGSVFTQLYFLWLILGLYAVAPMLAAFLSRGGRMRAVITGSVILGVTVLAYMVPGVAGLFGVARPIALNILTQWLPYVGYFVLGYALRDLRVSRGLRVALAAVIVVLAAFSIWHFGHKGQSRILDAVVSVSYLGIGVAILSVAVFVFTVSVPPPGKPWPARLTRSISALSQASFGVFLVHLVIFEVLKRLSPAIASGTAFAPAVGAFAVTLVLSFGVSLLAARIPYLRAIF
ncbi:hypothetical protein C6401_15755 [Arthrobacter woluwensis]|uniref:acyltransferase n=1 Tax=Arthrobacter woluwensis TaxID=156980 RepID=UPI000D124C5D|nr:acyltransferase family protein [Arthrobacter woluwensis]PSS42731.1 hypothetical protein C6401_15755 [Arthrobacter woluwensis]